MDVYCARCREPYDHTHLLEDELTLSDEAGTLTAEQISSFTGNLLDPAIVNVLQSAGWKFVGSSVFCIVQCPACHDEDLDARLLEGYEKRINEVKVLGVVLGDDEDGLINELNQVAHASWNV